MPQAVEFARGFFRARKLRDAGFGQRTPDVADVDADLFKHGATHESHVPAALQAMLFGLVPARRLESRLRIAPLDSFHARAEARL